MSTVVTTGLYEFDPRMQNPANLIKTERQTLQTPGRDDFFFIIPKAAPFFVRTLKLFNDATGAPLKAGIDYTAGHYFPEAMEFIDTKIAGSIRLLNHSLAGIVRLEYHTLGGDWGHDDASILAELSNRQYNPLVRQWGHIKELPYSFPVVPHDQSIDSLIGSPELRDAIDGVAKAIEATAAGSTQNHIADRSNPHQVTKAQVQLPNVPNWGVATDAAARLGQVTAGFMNPYLTALAIQAQALVPLNAHINDHDDPHNTTASHVGLGLVANYAPASPDEAIDPTIDNRYLTPYTASLLVASQSSAGQYEQLRVLMQNHIDARGNVHGLTAGDINVHTKEEIQALLTNVSAQDTPRFDGQTADEWRASLPSFANLTSVIDTIGTEFMNANATQLQVVVEDPRSEEEIENEAAAVINSVSAYFDHYYLYGDSRNIQIVGRPVALLPETMQAGVEKVVFLNNAVYWLEPDGSIRTAGSAIVNIPVAYRSGASFNPDNAAVSIAASKTAVYVTNASGRLTRLAAGNAVVLQSSGAFGVTVNNEHYRAGEFVLQEMEDGRVIPYGLAAWVTAANSVIGSLTSTIKETVIGDDRWLMILEDGSFRMYTISRTNGVSLNLMNNPANLPSEPTSVTGTYQNYSVMNALGEFLLLGNNDDGQLDVDLEIVQNVACGFNYVVTIDELNHVKFWGDSVDNALLYEAA